jgi:alpha-amylase/alpha-mannosidase (GH57 family)
MSATSKLPVALVIHAHFYQPPRDNPWTDEVPTEPSAAPFHDWNARIHAECYRANAYARIYGADDRIRAMVNNYARLSFNFGPTLTRWIARHDPRTLARVRAGDGEQQRRLGAGGAMAQVWGHPIVPLLSPNDRRTQIRWGLDDFRRRFGRDAEGIWLPETAADPASLEALIDAGVRLTIVAPEQIAAVRPPGAAWKTVDRDSVDTGRLYRWVSGRGGGRSIVLAVFDGPMSRELAFGNAARDAATLLEKARASAARSSAGARTLVLAASDGELYGHHKKFADLTLAYATAVEAEAQGFEVTNLAAFAAQEPPTWEAELAKGPHGEGTAWSCGHGIGRWRRHCGCAMRSPDESGWSQAWRTPLRDGLDLLRDRAAAFFEDAASDLFVDPWGARDAYGAVIDDPVDERARLLRTWGRAALAGGDAAALRRAHHLMEMQRSALLMYASCGWFFDDVAGLESALVLRQAAHVVDLWRQLGGTPPLAPFLDVLAQAKSNEPGLGNGADVFRRAAAQVVTPATAVVQATFGALLASGGAGANAGPSGFDIEALGGDGGTGPRRIGGQARVRHRRSGEETTVEWSASYDGATHLEAVVDGRRVRLEDLDETIARPLRIAAIIRLGAAPPTLDTCRAALALAAPLGKLAPAETAAVQDLFARLLIGLLDGYEPARVDLAVLSAAAELVERTDLGARNAHEHLAEDLIWDAMAYFRDRKKSPPRALRLLAERMRIAPAPLPHGHAHAPSSTSASTTTPMPAISDNTPAPAPTAGEDPPS